MQSNSQLITTQFRNNLFCAISVILAATTAYDLAAARALRALTQPSSQVGQQFVVALSQYSFLRDTGNLLHLSGICFCLVSLIGLALATTSKSPT